MKLGENIFKLRKKLGFSQEQLGEWIGVTRQTISNWELDETSPNPEQLKKLSKYLKVSIDNLLDNEFVEQNNSNKYSEKASKIIVMYFRVSLIIIVVLLLGFFIYKISKRSIKKNMVDIIEKELAIYCKIYGEEHGYRVKYNVNDDLIYRQDGDEYFIDVLDLKHNDYNYAHQVFNIINDYAKKNGGTCEKIENKSLNDIVSIYIKEGTLTRTGVIVMIQENVDYNISYGETFWIEKYNYRNSKFEKIKEVGNNCGFNLPAYGVNDGKILELRQDWFCMYGELDKGLYRLVKDAFFNSDIPVDEEDVFYISTEFEID